MFNTRKGITPVIAIVLLLLVTVGAVGVVYTQFQGLVQDPDTGFLEDVEINFQTVTRNGTGPTSTMTIRIQNQGEQEYNLTDVARMEYSVPGEQRLEKTVAGDSFSQIENEPTHECFTMDATPDITGFSPGTTATCDTGITMPAPDDEVTLYIVEQESGEVIVDYTCSPATSNSETC